MAGDKVLVRNVRQENRKGGKMDPDILGPFTIINIEGKNDDVISTKGKKKFKVCRSFKEVCGARASDYKKWIPSTPLSPPAPLLFIRSYTSLIIYSAGRGVSGLMKRM